MCLGYVSVCLPLLGMFMCLWSTVKQWAQSSLHKWVFKKLRYSVLSFPEWEPGGNRNRSKCLYSGQEYIWYMESFVLPTIQEWVRFAWNFYASVSRHTVCLMYKINWCINQIKSSMLPTFEFAHRDSIWIWRNSHFKKSLIGDGVTLR